MRHVMHHPALHRPLTVWSVTASVVNASLLAVMLIGLYGGQWYDVVV
jgi:hypothetical protein